jgi:hypothetical protein
MALTKISRGLLGTGVVNNTDGGIIISTDGYGRALLLPADENGTAENNLHYIGSSSYRWRDIYLSGSIDFNSDAVFKANGSERMRIDSSGNVGIGTTNPNTSLHTAAGSNSSGLIDVARFQNVGTSGGDGARIQLTSGTSTSGAGIGCLGYALNSAHLVFHSGGNNERMRIDSSGNLAIGTTTSNGKINIYYSASVFGQLLRYTGSANTIYPIIFEYGGATVGSISHTSSQTSFNENSDYRLKENINYEFDALDRVKQLKPARFNFIADADTTVDGFIAHEVSDIVPEAVTGEKDGEQMQGIDKSKLVPLLTKAIQELSAKVEELESKINE